MLFLSEGLLLSQCLEEESEIGVVKYTEESKQRQKSRDKTLYTQARKRHTTYLPRPCMTVPPLRYPVSTFVSFGTVTSWGRKTSRRSRARIDRLCPRGGSAPAMVFFFSAGFLSAMLAISIDTSAKLDLVGGEVCSTQPLTWWWRGSRQFGRGFH